MAISDLQSEFIAFARGMPAASISWRLVQANIANLLKSLAGTNPGSPQASMGNIPVVDQSSPPKTLYNMAYSVFLDSLSLNRNGAAVQLYFKLSANVHPVNQPTNVIRSYEIETVQQIYLVLRYDYPSNTLIWSPQPAPAPQITTAWGANADASLAATTVPQPQRATYENQIEPDFLARTSANVVSLVVNTLPTYSLSDILPWLKFHPPLRFNFGSSHILVTSSAATLTIGDCNPQTVDIVPDPTFPYGQQIPAPTLYSGAIDLSVYLPRTQLISFLAGLMEPAVQVSDSGGGAIKWALGGSVGLKSLNVTLQSVQGLTGVVSVQAGVDLVATAQAWVDGPSGLKLSLASASLIANGQVGANVSVTLDLVTGYVDASLTVTNCQVNPNWAVNILNLWPLNVLADNILDSVSTNEAQKLTGHVVQLGKWNVLGLVQGYLATLPSNVQAKPYSEGLAQVSALVAVESYNP